MRAMIVDKFCHRGVFCPCFRVGAAEDSKIGFYFLIDPFCFSIGLWMVRSGQGDLISKDLAQFQSKLRRELRSSVRDYFVEEAEASE